MHLKPSWRLGFLLPGLLLLTLVADVALRLLPVDRLAFRPWEAVRRFRPADEAFEPNRRLSMARSYGVLAAAGNLPALRQYRPETFTTDAHGYRNPPAAGAGAGGRAPEALLVGSSMATGVGNSDADILSVQLAALTGRPVYNASLTFDLHSLERTRAVARRVGLRAGVVIFEYLEAYDLPQTRHDGVPEPCFRLLAAAGRRDLDPLCTTAYGLARVSPLRIFAERAYRTLQNDVVLPNIHARTVAQRRLRDGAPMLFPVGDVRRFSEAPDVAPAADYLAWLAAELARDDLDLLVVLLPTAYTVHRPLLAPPEPPAPAAPPYLARLEARLRAAGVPVVNLTGPLTTQAARALERGAYLYWRDDHHWNARGIAVAAGEIRRAWEALLVGDGGPGGPRAHD
jgi:SGNH hydrolase-like domain, acetyltransferase AlgX